MMNGMLISFHNHNCYFILTWLSIAILYGKLFVFPPGFDRNMIPLFLSLRLAAATSRWSRPMPISICEPITSEAGPSASTHPWFLGPPVTCPKGQLHWHFFTAENKFLKFTRGLKTWGKGVIFSLRSPAWNIDEIKVSNNCVDNISRQDIDRWGRGL